MTTETLLTAEDYLRMPSQGQPTELVRGKIVMMNRPGGRHGKVCGRVCTLVSNFVDDHGLGHVFSNDSGVITSHDPDTVRGPDVCFYSYARMPKDEVPISFLPPAPELVFEVLSPDDRWKHVLAKVAEYLEAGVLCVCVVDPQRQTARVYSPDLPEQAVAFDQELVFPAILPGFALPLRRLFE
ncbi:MAG: Uma2 family endonuclease [Pirellulales bacterium]